MVPYMKRKVIPIGTVSELTGLTVRQIRYYEERKLVTPERTTGNTRKYSFEDVEALVEIANKMEDGMQTTEILKMRKKETREREVDQKKIREELIKGQLNVQFHRNQLPFK
ncbi:MAG: transcriptional regulator [Paenibacillaceae bacterium]|nr:transcriptional regulator [Paenibacillaceae bacterium]